MTNHDFAQAYRDQAKAIVRELELHYGAREWHLVVRRAQEAVELVLKSLLREAGVEVPRLHDVGHLLQQEVHRLPQVVQKELPRMISISRRLRQERETSFYGDEEQELPPSALYTEVDAAQVRDDVAWLLTVVAIY